MKFTKKDLLFSIITGLTTGIVAWRILMFLGVPEFMGISTCWLVVVVPILWILGVNFGYFLGKWLEFFNQFGKYAAVGFTNAAVDFGVLNLLIASTGIAVGIYYTLFKAISFLFASVHSYFWNRLWVFGAGKNQNQGLEVAKFFSVLILSTVINIGVASLVVNFITPLFGLDAKAWANVGAVVGNAVALAFNFVGFKLAVFKDSSKR